MKIDRWKHQNQLQIEPRSLKFALRSSSGAILSRKREQDRVKSVQERVKRPFGGSKAKGTHQIAEGIPRMGGVGGYAEAGGGVRGGKLPEFGGECGKSSALFRTLRSRRKRRVRRIEFASRDRRTLVGVRRRRAGAAGKFSA